MAAKHWTVTVDIYVLAETEEAAERIVRDAVNAGTADVGEILSCDITDAVKDS